MTEPVDLLHTMTPVIELSEGDYVDLEGDQYADPKGDTDLYQFECVVVTGWEAETSDCLRIDFENSSSVGFPPRHKVRVRKEPT